MFDLYRVFYNRRLNIRILVLGCRIMGSLRCSILQLGRVFCTEVNFVSPMIWNIIKRLDQSSRVGCQVNFEEVLYIVDMMDQAN